MSTVGLTRITALARTICDEALSNGSGLTVARHLNGDIEAVRKTIVDVEIHLVPSTVERPGSIVIALDPPSIIASWIAADGRNAPSIYSRTTYPVRDASGISKCSGWANIYLQARRRACD